MLCTIGRPEMVSAIARMIAMIAKIFNTRMNVSSPGRPKQYARDIK